MLIISLAAGVTQAYSVLDINSLAYVSIRPLRFRLDFSVIHYTHFRIFGDCYPTVVATQVDMQLARHAAPAVALSGAGPDLSVFWGGGEKDSGWVALADPLTVDELLIIAIKGSTPTLDLNLNHLHLAFKAVE